MFILDTNVVSEMMKQHPNGAVMAWLDTQLTETLFITAITEAEIRMGIALLPDGRRRRLLHNAAERVFQTHFKDRILPFDSIAAPFYAIIAAERRAAGRPISHADCQIAAIARSHGGVVATRDIDDYDEYGIEVFDPWSARVQ